MSEVELVTGREALAILERLGVADRVRGAAPEGAMFEGFVDFWLRDATTGAVEDELHQPNVVTDFARRNFARDPALANSYIFSSPSREAANSQRYALFDSGASTASQMAGTTSPTYDAATLTRSWAHTFSAPTQTRDIGTIGLAKYQNVTYSFGVYEIVAYTVLTPLKKQTTTQTLEVLYRITLNPIY